MGPTILLLRVFVAARTCLPSRCLATIGGIQIQTHSLSGGIYEECRSDGLRYHDIHTKFREDWFRHSKVDREHTHSNTHTDREMIS
jgi:hypothetical protein